MYQQCLTLRHCLLNPPFLTLSFDWAPSYYITDHTLNTLDPDYSSKWRKYLQLKQHFYMAYVRSQYLVLSRECDCGLHTPVNSVELLKHSMVMQLYWLYISYCLSLGQLEVALCLNILTFWCRIFYTYILMYLSLTWQAYCYHGQTLLASDKCGEAIRSLQEAEKCEFMHPDKGEIFDFDSFTGGVHKG